MKSKLKKFVGILLSAVFVVVFSVTAFGADPVTSGLNIGEMLGGALAGFLPEMLSVIGIVAPIVIGVILAQTGIAWGIRIFRSLTGR